ncbi:hypothetical protein PN498_20840 [Oscillatoria sp. CS-180]|uniref:hypothetical protein n=1 Tax=Oscillatoria sp. CS-180 TaxID=3021720 RepID=UPI00232FF881|nr:hypothetical protein [Oscillatoria sp. CS-180]MDB9528451.1 hypothetical protein [Oscillatoria sp. CS-180]
MIISQKAMLTVLTSALATTASLAVNVPVKAQDIVNSRQEASPEILAQFPAVEVRKTPDAFVSPIRGAVDMTLVNGTPSVVSFMIPNTGRYVALQPEEEFSLMGLDLPAQVGFRQLDGGLTRAAVVSAQSNQDMVTVEFLPADSILTQMGSIVVSESGSVYLD